MKKYKLINSIAGWAIFLIAAVVYLKTIEPTASFWDCGEFISAAYKMEVGHPPGAPIFMLIGNLFTQLTSDPSQVAKMINSMSAIMSALTIMFLFWTITHLTRKLVLKKDSETIYPGQTIMIIGSGIVGALAYTFSDTFWFSAVEGEVYAFSSMLTALVFWLILKWEDNAHKADSDKWIVLIAYVMGLSIGVHLLGLLCIPAIVMVYYYKTEKNITWKGSLLALLLSFALMVILMYGIVPGFTKVGGWFELFFVNTLGFSYNSGVFAYIIVLLAAVAWSLFETLSPKGSIKRGQVAFVLSLALSGILFIGSSALIWLILIAVTIYFVFVKKRISTRVMNISMSSLMVIIIGFSAYAIIPIRSAANPPLDLNSPEDIFSLASYLNREQYGQTPLFHGTTYVSQVKRDAEGNPIVAKETKSYSKIIKNSPDEKDKYKVSTYPTYKYTNTMLFPRMHSNPTKPGFGNHMQGYEIWGGVVNKNEQPSFFQNVKFLFNYQINFMYWRYFMWNFSGRQNDIQGDGGMTKGNWMTGISFIDKAIGLGPQDNIAPEVADNKGRNKFYMLPLILGLIGIIYQLRLKEKGLQNFIVVFLLFFMTGLAIVLYLNQTPYEPRERDYAYAGSFYAFAIWIGIGVAGIGKFLRNYIKNTTIASSIAIITCLLVPLQMVSQTWDDHDRSGRTLARDTGMNYLTCVEPGGIIFCNGDNDTYPLWYVQETEGFRTDVRATNMSFLQTEWYIDQLLCQAYESEPLPINWTRERYWSEAGDMAYVLSESDIIEVLKRNSVPPTSYGQYYDTSAYRDTISLRQTMENLRTGNNAIPKNPFGITDLQIVPGKVLAIDVDTTKINWTGINSKPSDKMYVNLAGKQTLRRIDLMFLEMLNNVNDNNWQRPLTFAITVDRNLYMNLQEKNFSLTGLAYQIVPGIPQSKAVNTEKTYDNMMNKFKWGGLEKNPNIYLDETCRRMISTFRISFNLLIEALISEGKNEKALAALDKCISVMPASAVPFGNDGILYGRAYYRINEDKKAAQLLQQIDERVNKNINWYYRLSPQQINNAAVNIYDNVNQLLLLTSVYQEFDKEKYVAKSGELMKLAETSYKSGIGYIGDFILKELTDSAIRSYYTSDESEEDKIALEEGIVKQTSQLMQQYSPNLLQQYSKAQE